VTTVLWHCAALHSADYLVVDSDASGGWLHGDAVLTREDEPCRITYEIRVSPSWWTLSASALVTTPEKERRIYLQAGTGTWLVDGVPAAHLVGCIDVDFGWTPATNTVAIRRLGLEVGSNATITAALVRFPELEIVASPQTYHRLTHNRWRFQSGDFEAELLVEPESGLVLQYAEDLWRAVAKV
jgi:uncharacterized protein